MAEDASGVAFSTSVADLIDIAASKPNHDHPLHH